MFSALLIDAFRGCDDGNLFNLRLQTTSKAQTDVLDELLFAGGVAMNALTEKKM